MEAELGATVCLIWGSAVILVSGLGYIQLCEQILLFTINNTILTAFQMETLFYAQCSFTA